MPLKSEYDVLHNIKLIISPQPIAKTQLMKRMFVVSYACRYAVPNRFCTKPAVQSIYTYVMPGLIDPMDNNITAGFLNTNLVPACK